MGTHRSPPLDPIPSVHRGDREADTPTFITQFSQPHAPVSASGDPVVWDAPPLCCSSVTASPRGCAHGHMTQMPSARMEQGALRARPVRSRSPGLNWNIGVPGISFKPSAFIF